MVLVSCKECGHQVSSLADSCPACGNKDILSWRERFSIGREKFSIGFHKAKAAAEEKERAKAIEKERFSNRSPEEIERERQQTKDDIRVMGTCLVVLILFGLALYCGIKLVKYLFSYL